MKKLLLSLSAVLFSAGIYAQGWVAQPTGFTTDSRGIAGLEVKDANTVWAYAYDGMAPTTNIQEFTKTSNGGASWTAGTIDLGDPTLPISNISGVDANNAWVMATNANDGSGGVFHTSDGGATWGFQSSASAASWNNWVHFFDASNGVFMGDPVAGVWEIYTTSDGGTTWTPVPAANMPAPLASEYGYNGGYTYVGNNLFFYTGKGRILKSTDMGQHWSVILSTGVISDFGSAAVNGDMAFSDANTGMIFRKTYNSAGTTQLTFQIWTTTNGSTWTQVVPKGLTMADKANDIAYVPGTQTLVATASAGGSWKSSDNGASWTKIDALQHLSVKCADITNCYSGGFSGATSGMYKSTASLLGLNELNAAKASLNIYPNPVNESFQMRTTGYDASKLKVTITDMTGKNVKIFGAASSYNVKDLPKGTYIVKVSDGNKTEVKKVIKN